MPLTTTTTTTKKKTTAVSPVVIAGGVAALSGVGALTSGLLTSGAGAGAVAGVAGLLPQSCSVSRINPPAGLEKLVPWNTLSQDSKMTFGTLPALKTAGSVDILKVPRTWKAGQPVDQVLTLGDLDGTYNTHCMTMGSIARLGAVDTSKYNLTGLKWFKDTTLKGLSETIYARVTKISEMPGLSDYLAPNLPKVSKTKLDAMSLKDALNQFPDLAKMEMGMLPLTKVPGFLSTVTIKDIPDWKKIPVAKIPGLSKVPFSKFPSNPMKNAEDSMRAPSIRSAR